MELIYIILILLFIIIIADILNKIFSKIPLIFFEITLGAVFSFLPIFRTFTLDPEIFMLVIIKPLLFNEAQHIDKDELKEFLKPIISLSIPLVIITIFVTAFLINLIFPTIPLTITFILSSIIIPTNYGSLKEITHNLNMPKHSLAILEGESLFSDSIAIVIFNFAVSAILTGTFSFVESFFEFLFILFGGIIVGIILGFIIVYIRVQLIKNNMESASMLVLIQILTPFIVYIVAHNFHVSSILAVISAGMVHSIEKPLLNLKSAKLQTISNNTWDVFNYVLDGIVSVALGILLPSIIKNVSYYHSHEFKGLILVAIFIYVIVSILRYLWVFSKSELFIEKDDIYSKSKSSLIFSIGAINGTITLAIAVSTPVNLGFGEIFVFRNELIFIASIVILISLIVPTILFPLILSIKKESSIYTFEDARKAMLEYSISELEKYNYRNSQNSYAINAVFSILRKQLKLLDSKSKSFKKKELIRYFSIASKIEYSVTDKFVKENKVSKIVGIFYKRYVTYSNNIKFKSLFFKIGLWEFKRKIKKAMSNSDYKYSQSIINFVDEFSTLQIYSSNKVLNYLNSITNDENSNVISFIMNYYREKLNHNEKNIDFYESSRSYFSMAFNLQFLFVQDLLEKKLISTQIAHELKQQINFDKIIYVNTNEFI